MPNDKPEQNPPASTPSAAASQPTASDSLEPTAPTTPAAAPLPKPAALAAKSSGPLKKIFKVVNIYMAIFVIINSNDHEEFRAGKKRASERSRGDRG